MRIARPGKVSLRFGHDRRTLSFWRRLAGDALKRVPTPFYLFSVEPVREALAELAVLDRQVPIPVRHWLSCKTQPVPAMLRWWQRQGRGIEVVSEFELLAALKAGFAHDRILVNGPAKHRWLPQYAAEGLRVNFDSPSEMEFLLPYARRHQWSVGVRCQTAQEFDPEHPECPTQFGMQPREAVIALKTLLRSRAKLETIHFHLRTNVAAPGVYERALADVAGICRAAHFRPKHVDCGGGFPPPHVLTHDGHPYNAEFHLNSLAAMYTRALKQFESPQELWLENGRFLSARSGVLVVRILDVKERRLLRQLICDGGRTTHALISNWESHALFSLPERHGPKRGTAIYGPTCMAFDQLARRPMPGRLRAGDHLVWMDAGAYHIPWETRFSHGLASVVWHEEDRLTLVRRAERFGAWWNQWERPQAPRRSGST